MSHYRLNFDAGKNAVKEIYWQGRQRASLKMTCNSAHHAVLIIANGPTDINILSKFRVLRVFLIETPVYLFICSFRISSQHLATKRCDFTNFKMFFLALQLWISLIDLLRSIFSQGIVYLLFSSYKPARRAQTTSSDKNVVRVV